ncbi:unnamed protein product [Brassica oleracea var. botrytis]
MRCLLILLCLLEKQKKNIKLRRTEINHNHIPSTKPG